MTAAPDDDLGERIVAWVVVEDGRSATPDELSDHVANLLTKHKRPREVHFLDELPRNAMGKVRKRDLGHNLADSAELITKRRRGAPKPLRGRPAKSDPIAFHAGRHAGPGERLWSSFSSGYRPGQIRSISGEDPILLPPPESRYRRRSRP